MPEPSLCQALGDLGCQGTRRALGGGNAMASRSENACWALAGELVCLLPDDDKPVGAEGFHVDTVLSAFGLPPVQGKRCGGRLCSPSASSG